jgi:hypothetical protein
MIDNGKCELICPKSHINYRIVSSVSHDGEPLRGDGQGFVCSQCARSLTWNDVDDEALILEKGPK